MGMHEHTVFDTGSSRSSVDKSYVEALLAEPRTRTCVKDVQKIVPIECKSVDAKNPIIIRSTAKIPITFRASGNKRRITKDLWFFVIDGSSEDLILGKPTLDSLGFVSDRYHIELRCLDLRFATVLPDQLPNKNVTFLKLEEYQEFDGSLNHLQSRMVDLIYRRL